MVLNSPQAQRSSQSLLARESAAAALRAGNVNGARQRLQQHVAMCPTDAEALQLLGEIAASQYSVDEATILFRRAVVAEPSGERRIVLVRHLQRMGRPDLALEEIEQLSKAMRADFEVRKLEAAICGALGHHERQVRLYRTMARERPSDARPWILLGDALRTVGRTDEAVKALQRALRAAPKSGEAYWALANLKSFKFSSRDIAHMRELARQPLPASEAANLHFALGKALEDRGDYEESFRHYAAANAVRAQGFRPEETSVSGIVDESIGRFTADFFERNADAGCPEPGPIFVVGLYRSGSTLIEQILSSHSMIEGTDELQVMNDIRFRLERTAGTNAVEAIAALKPAEIRSIGEEYLARTRPFRKTDRPFFVDKLPANWANLPLIRAALPKARIIDARRHPMACGFANFRQNYSMGVGFSFNQKTIGAFYRDYWRFMRHFDEVQPGVVHRVIYERLIDDPEGEIRGMLDYLAVPFEPSCLEFHRNERAVRTPSAEQVRRPISRSALEQWKNYEPWLGELQQALGTALDSWTD